MSVNLNRLRKRDGLKQMFARLYEKRRGIKSNRKSLLILHSQDGRVGSAHGHRYIE